MVAHCARTTTRTGAVAGEYLRALDTRFNNTWTSLSRSASTGREAVGYLDYQTGPAPLRTASNGHRHPDDFVHDLAEIDGGQVDPQLPRVDPETDSRSSISRPRR